MIRFTLPHADPYLFPLVAVLACFGLVVVYRIDEELARDQAQWFVIGLIAVRRSRSSLLRDFRVLERYRYTIALAGLALLLLPRVPGIGQQVNGAYLGVKLGPISFQPAEFGKIAIVIFLAAYLRDTRQVLVQGSRRVLGVTIPRAQALRPAARGLGRGDADARLHPRPRLVADVLRRLPGAGLRRHQPVLSFVVAGLVMFAAGAWFFAIDRRPRAGPHRHLAGPVRRPLRRDGGSYQIANGLFAQADGGLFGQGLGAALLNLPDGGPLIPAPADGHDLRRHRQRPRARRRLRADRRPTC